MALATSFTFVNISSSSYNGRLQDREKQAAVRSQAARGKRRSKLSRRGDELVPLMPSRAFAGSKQDETYDRLREELEQSFFRACAASVTGMLIGGCLFGVSSQRQYELAARIENYALFTERTSVLVRKTHDAYLRSCYEALVQTNQTTTLNVIMLHGVAHYDAYKDEASDDAAGLGIVLREVSGALAEPLNDFASKSVLVGVLILCYYEMCKNGERLDMHRAGLKRIVDHCGGLASIQYIKIREMLLYTDLMTSMYLDVDPQHDHDSQMRKGSFGRAQPPMDLFSMFNPYIAAEEPESTQEHNSHISKQSCQLLADAATLYRLAFPSDVTHVMTDPKGDDARAAQRALQALESSSVENVVAPRTTADYLNEAIRLASLIWSRTMLGGTPFKTSSNKTDVQRLRSCTSWISLEAWSGLPFVFLWIVLVGCSASGERTREKRYFFAELNRHTFGFLGFGDACVIMQDRMMKSHLRILQYLRRDDCAVGLSIPVRIPRLIQPTLTEELLPFNEESRLKWFQSQVLPNNKGKMKSRLQAERVIWPVFNESRSTVLSSASTA